MIKIQAHTFRRAAEKARSINPRCIKDGAHYFVARSERGGFARVIFTLRPDGLWARCDCPAGRGKGRPGNVPDPCYHVAAAIIAEQTHKLMQSAPAHTAPAPDVHSHWCPRCGHLYDCGCPDWAIDDLICNACEEVELEHLDADIYFHAA